LIAIDSAKTLGLPIDVEIYDSQETKIHPELPRLYQTILQNGKCGSWAFYQSNAEATALLSAIMCRYFPLSKDAGNPFGNLFQTIPAPGSEE
jgi:hypothetical protein